MDDKINPQPTQTKTLEELKRQTFYSTIGVIIVIVLLILMVSCVLNSDGDGKERCAGCNGTGYYNSKYCPICDGKGEVDSETNDRYYDTINKYGMRQ